MIYVLMVSLFVFGICLIFFNESDRSIIATGLAFILLSAIGIAERVWVGSKTAEMEAVLERERVAWGEKEKYLLLQVDSTNRLCAQWHGIAEGAPPIP